MSAHRLAITPRTGAGVAALAAVLWLGLGAEIAFATNPPPPIRPRPQPLDCKTAAAELGAEKIWWGRFAGKRDDPFGRENFMPLQHLQTTSRWACFKTEVDCRNWLYWMYSDWPVFQTIARCDLGFKP